MSRRIKKWFVALILIAAAAAAVYAAAWKFVVGWTPPRGQYPLQGLTVSESNGPVIWPSVKALGADFAYVRATAGAGKRDVSFAENYAQANQAGLRTGALHQYSLCRMAQDQATNFVTTVPRDADALPPAVELSFQDNCAKRPTRALVLSELGTFLNQIERHTGKPAVLLIRPDFEKSYRVSEAIPRTIWLSGNFLPPDYAAKPWVMWEANRYYRIKGIDGPVRWNVVRTP